MDAAGQELGAALWLTFEEIIRNLHAATGTQQAALDAIMSTAIAMIEPAGEVGVIVVERGGLRPVATTSSEPHELDVFQQQSGVGPCLDAARQHQLILLDDTETEQRWPEFALQARGRGVGSMLCLPLWVGGRRFGTLSLYSRKPYAFGESDAALARLFAAAAAVALDAADTTHQLSAAIESRDLIGQAKGILMERRKFTAQEAFECLVLASQAANVKLVAIADHLVRTGELIGIDVPAAQYR